jgi:hypothetical protein
MARSSCITHSPRQQMVIIREDYLRIADNNHCAAALLNIFEYWHNVKLAEQDQALIEKEIAKAGGAPLVDAELWVYKSIPDFQEEVLGLFGETKISAALKLLHEKGFIESRNNPKYGWDRTLQYLFIVDIVQAAILSFPSRKSTASTNRKNKASKTLNSRDASVKNKAAIPETTTETTTEKKEKEIPLSKDVIETPAIVEPTENAGQKESVSSAADGSVTSLAEQDATKTYVDDLLEQARKKLCSSREEEIRVVIPTIRTS